MAVFLFQAKSHEGRFVKGELDALNEQEARIKIRAQRLVPLKVLAKEKQSESKGMNLNFSSGVPAKDLQIFTRQFSVLVASGVPIVQGIESLAQGSRSPNLVAALNVIRGELERGKRLGDALALRPKIFDRLYINLVKAGEEGGVLDTVLQRLAEYIEKSNKLRSKILGAMWYPAAILAVAALVISGILIFVIPTFKTMFESMGQELPALTQFVIDLSELFVAYWYMLILLAIGVPLALKFYYNTPDGRKVLDGILINLPVMGPLLQKGAIARVARTLSTLLSSGVRIMDALEIAAATAGNWVIEKAILDAKDHVSRGKGLAEPLRNSKFFPSMVIQMISVGESTGNIDTMLSKVADFYEDEVEAAASALTSIMEPIMMVFLGGIIAVLVIAMYLPIFNLAGAVG